MITDLFSLKDRVAVVTGGYRGIGRMITQGFLQSGAKVYITGRKAERCEAAAEELSAFGECIAIPGDLANVDNCQALAADIAAREPKLDILVNNAGAAWAAPFGEFPESGWDKVMDLNVKSLFFLTQAMHGSLKAAASETQPAKVINIASIDGIKINPWETYSYQASKAAVIHLTRRMAARLIQDQICVSGIAPGAFSSEMNKAAALAGDQVAKQLPAGRIGEDTDMAGAAIFLASKAGNYVVGDTIVVDGGVANSQLGEPWG